MYSSRAKCRLCLVQNNCTDMYELFDEANSVNHLIKFASEDQAKKLLKLSEHVEYCYGIKLRFCKEMPTKMCSKCFNTIRIWYNFRHMCLSSQLYLESLELSRNSTCDINFLNNLVEDLQTLPNRKIINILKQNDEYIGQPFPHVQNDNSDYNIENNEENDDNDNDDDGDEQCYEVDANIDGCTIDISDKVLLKEYIQIDPQFTTNSRHEWLEDCSKNALKPCNIEDGEAITIELTSDDLSEVLNFLNAEQNQQLEDYVQYISECDIDQNLNHLKHHMETRFEKLKKKVDIWDNRKNQLPKPMTFMCSICGNVYTKRPLFQYHLRTHSSIKAFQCEICHKSYRMMNELKNHMYRHTGERPFKCKYCERNFMDRSSRHRHERLHSNSRPYVCNICHKSFSYSAILKNHLKLHSGEKNFICTICDKSFTLQHQLKAHLLTMTHKQREATQELKFNYNSS